MFAIVDFFLKLCTGQHVHCTVVIPSYLHFTKKQGNISKIQNGRHKHKQRSGERTHSSPPKTIQKVKICTVLNSRISPTQLFKVWYLATYIKGHFQEEAPSKPLTRYWKAFLTQIPARGIMHDFVLFFVGRSCHSPYRCMRGVDFHPKDCQHRVVFSAKSMLLVQVRAFFKVMHHSPYLDDDDNRNEY